LFTVDFFNELFVLFRAFAILNSGFSGLLFVYGTFFCFICGDPLLLSGYQLYFSGLVCVSMPERGLHAELKEWLRKPGDLVEGTVWGYRADIIRGDLLIEIQTGNFPQIRAKLAKLLNGYRVRLVYPVPERRWVIREVDGKQHRRVSPHIGRVEEVFNELIYCPTLPLAPNFSLEVLLVYAEEAQAVRWRGKRRTRYTVTERHLVKVVNTIVFEKPVDYLHLLPKMNGAFTTRQLSKAAGLRITLARRMVYCLAKMGLIEEVGTVARAKLYHLKAS